MNADQVANVLLEGDEEMYKSVIQQAISPSWRIISAFKKDMALKFEVRGAEDWSFVLEVEIPGPMTLKNGEVYHSSLRFLRLKWRRPDDYKGFGAREEGRYQFTFKIHDVDKLKPALDKIFERVRKPSTSPEFLQQAIMGLHQYEWVSKYPTRRRRRR